MHRAIAASAGVAATACAYQHAPIANPTGLPPAALSLEYLLGGGCLPYVTGRAGEQSAMQSVGLHHMGKLPSLTPDSVPQWLGGYPGLSNVVVGADSCHVNMHPGDAAAYRAAAERALGRWLGPDVRPDPAYKAWLPGQQTGCRQGVRFTCYQSPRSDFFSVDLYRVDCAHDPMRGAS